MASPGAGYIDPLGRGAESMLIQIVFGAAFGFLAGLGVGGGTLLILWLTAILGMDADTARKINLLFFLAAAGVVSIIRWKKGKLPLKIILPTAIAACVSAWIFTKLRIRFNKDLLRHLFGALLLIVGVKELFYRQRKAK